MPDGGEKETRVKFKPAVLVEDIKLQDPSRSQQALSRVVKALLADEEADTRHRQLCALPTQGKMARQWEGQSPELWVKEVQVLPPVVMKFSLIASLDTLPTNSNLHLWGKKAHNTCPLCRESRQTLLHVLNNCPVHCLVERREKGVVPSRADYLLRITGG